MDKATRLNMLDANRELFKRVVSQVGEFRTLEPVGEDHQTGKDTRNADKPQGIQFLLSILIFVQWRFSVDGIKQVRKRYCNDASCLHLSRG